MRGVIVVLGLLVLTLSITSCQSQSSVQETITRFKLTNESVLIVSGDPIEESFRMTVTYEITDENDEISEVILADGQFIDGELKLTQRITVPTEVEMYASTGADTFRPRTAVVLRPDSEIDFTVVNRAFSSSSYYVVLLNRNDHRSLKENMRFSLKGNLSQLPIIKPHLIEVSLRALPSFVDGSGDSVRFGPVMPENGFFSIEGDLDKPRLFTITITHRSRFLGESERVHAILEPGINYRVAPLGSQGRHAVISDRDSLHTQVVSGWQLNPEYVELVDTWVDKRLDARWGMEREAEEEHERELVRNYQVAEECSHVKLTDEKISTFSEPYKYAFQNTADQIVTTRAEALRKILSETQDPELVRMIFDLSWRLMQDDEIRSERDVDEKILTLLELEQKMDQDYIDQFVTPRVEHFRKEKSMKMRYSTLRPGQVVPQFKLPTVTGDEVSLSDVLSENELVFLDFWASWCGWCITDFPELKRIYSQHKDLGFEIITISIDDSFEDWELASLDEELPWVDLGDAEDGVLKVSSSPTADGYGVRWRSHHPFDQRLYDTVYSRGTRLTAERLQEVGRRLIPNKFLIDKNGCILDKQFSLDALEEILISRLIDMQ